MPNPQDKLDDFMLAYSSKVHRAQIAADDHGTALRQELIAHLGQDPTTASLPLIGDVLREESKWSRGRDIDFSAFARLMSHFLDSSGDDAMAVLLSSVRQNMDLDGTLSSKLRLSVARKEQLLAELDQLQVNDDNDDAFRTQMARNILLRARTSDA